MIFDRFASRRHSSRKTSANRKLRDAVRPISFTAVESLEMRQMLAAHIVGSTTNYATIQAAVDAANAGATITVDAGTYNQSVTITTNNLTIKGAKSGVDARGRSTSGESIVTGASGSAGIGFSFLIKANDVTLDGFTIQGETSKSTVNGAGITIAPNIFGTHILNNILQNNVAGMFLANNSSTDAALIQHNVFQNNNNAGINGGRGIYTDGGIAGAMLTNVTIDANTFTNNRGGSGTTGLEAAVAIEAQTAGKQTNFRITSNTFTNNGKSVLFFNTTGVLIQGNTASGAADWYSGSFRFEGNNHDVQILNNNIINNPGPGVAVDSSGVAGNNSGFVVNYNNIYGNGTNSTYGKLKLGVVFNQSVYTGTFDARNNYWGNANGPSGDGPGTGDSVYGNAYKTGNWHVATGGSEVFSPWSTTQNPITVTTQSVPGAPSALAASAISATQINLTWALGSGTATNIFVERSLDGTNFSPLATLAGNASSYSDTGLSQNTKYYYRAHASNSAGSSGNSNVANATTASIAGSTNLSDLTWSSGTTGYGTLNKNASVNGNTLNIAGVNYAKGIGGHALSVITYNLGGAYNTFQSDVGIDTEVDPKGQGKVEFIVIGDGKTLFDSGVMSNDQVQHINVSVAGVQTLTLKAVNGIANNIDYDHADWGGATLIAGAITAPPAPTGLAASAASSSQIKLTWTAGPANLTGYAIDRSTDGTNFTTVATNVAGSATTWTDPASLTANTKYYYQIRAINSAGPSVNSAIVNATTLSATATTTYLSDMTWTSATVGYGTIHKDASISGNTITLHGQTYAKGIGAHAVSNIVYNLGGNYTNFLSDVGVDDEENGKGIGSVDFQVIGDGKVLFDSGVLTNGNAPVSINISVAGVQTLTLVATNGVQDSIDYDHADWAGARLLGGTTQQAATLSLPPGGTTTTTTTTTDTAASMLKSPSKVL